MARKATIAIVFLLSLTLCLDSFAGRTSSSRSSGSRSRSSSSKPKYSAPARSSTPLSKPKYSSGSGASSSSAKSKYGSGSSTPAKPKYGSGSGASSTPAKPKYGSGSAQRKYEPTKKATAPPKASYTSSTGKTVPVKKDSAAVKTIRSKPSSTYTPAARTQRTEVHITSHGYSHPYSYYHSHSPYYMGGGYSSAYWWMMMEWDASRRARWLYNNQSNIEASAYKEGMQDAAVAAEIARLQEEKAVADPNYVDEEFADNPDLMYDQDYVEAAYNPAVVPPKIGASILTWLIAGGILIFVVWLLFFRVRW